MFKEGNEVNLLLVLLALLAAMAMCLGFYDKYTDTQIQLNAIKAGLVQTVEQGKIVWTKK